MNEIKLLELEKTDYKKKFFKFLLSQIVGTWGGGGGLYHLVACILLTD